MVKTTVLMAVRDTPAAMLRQAIESIRGQTLREFEFLILDDGSERAETCAELERQAAADARICLERGPSHGLTATLNRGLALAAGEFIARQDADDWSEPDRLARVAEAWRQDAREDVERKASHLDVMGFGILSQLREQNVGRPW